MATISVNLLGFEAKGQKQADIKTLLKQNQLWFLVVGMILASGGAAYGGSIYLQDQLDLSKAEQASLEGKIKDLDDKLKDLKNLEAERDNLVKERMVLEQVTKTSFYWSKLLNEIRNQMPENLWISDFKTGGDGTSRTDSLSLRGQSMTYHSVAVFVVNLQKSPYFMTVTLAKTGEIPIVAGKGSNQSVVDFDLQCKIKGGVIEVAKKPDMSEKEAKELERSKNFFQAIQAPGGAH